MDEFGTTAGAVGDAVPDQLRALFNNPDDVRVQQLPSVLPGFDSLAVHFGVGARMMWAPLGDLGVCESGDVGCVELLEFDGGAPAQGAVASLPVVEDLQVLKDRVGEFHAGIPTPAVQ
jgi:hypothetical protein